MKKYLLALAIASTTFSMAHARDFDATTLDYRNIKEGPESPTATRDPNYPVDMYIGRSNLVIENRTDKPIEVNGFMFDSAGCDDLDLPKDMFRLPPHGRFITFVGHCPANTMKWGWLNVGSKKKLFKLN